jgi:hypothetical protein
MLTPNRAHQIIIEIAQLMEELTQLDLASQPPLSMHPLPTPTHRPFKRGDRVRISRRDKYYGRVGTITNRHGSIFWDILLDRTPRDPMAITIYKKETSLVLLQHSANT